MSRPAPLRPGDPRRLGRYRLIGRLGEGGQGVVFVAESPDRPRVAVKALHARLLGDEKVRRRLIGEIEAVRRVAPFCTAQVLDADLDGERPYIVSEFVDGVSLQEHITAEGPRADGSLDRIAVGTATALAAIHRAGVVHRDFKPANVLLGMDGPRVIDFGISRMMDATLTTGKIPFGTPAYMSPEQIKGEPAGPPADMFSWALTVAFAATGRHAFSADSYHEVLARVLYGRPDLGPLTGRLRRIVVACLAAEPGDRPVAEEVLHQLYGNGAVITGPVGASVAGGVETAEFPVTEEFAAEGAGTAEFPVMGELAGGAGAAEFPVTGEPVADGAETIVPAEGGSPPRRSRRLLIAAAAAVAVAVAAGAFALWFRGDSSLMDTRSRDDFFTGTWTGVASHSTAERVFPVEIRFADESASMKWGADLHCAARLTRTSAEATYRLEQVTGSQCYPGTVVFTRRAADKLGFQVTRPGESKARYSGDVFRSP
ncbi:serine/threonine-protein kinase [Streptosporangium sp. NPDC000396]|uniref:serine/threonine-protein kinase n=1 Tax=Streptosporangium sp. NPDC000396 TaxID=3366185 RepID=UPI00369CAEDD